MKEMHDDRVHARMALVRDLFGLSVDEGVGVAPAADADDEPSDGLAEVRELRRRAPARGG